MDSYIDTMDTSAAAGGIIAVVLAILGIVLLIVFIVSIFQIIGHWKMFKKAGEPGWAALVPIYNTYILCKITGVNPWWIVITFCASLLSFIPVIGSLLVMAVTIYFGIMLAGSTANSFGKDTGWAIGLYFLAPFFSFALGVGTSEYVGPTPMNDPIMAAFNKSQNNQQSNVASNQSGTAKFCSNCGNKLDANVGFCPNCGNKIK
ncbi:MAG: zinc ribbon domain-containing protein [Bacilli bacterium]|nr:zinc ribbon domain-containing protein [Bacilli bacterium]